MKSNSETKVIISCENKKVLSGVLMHIDQREVQVLRKLKSAESAADERMYFGGDAVIFDVARLRLIARKYPEALNAIAQSARIILVLESLDLVDALDLLDRCHGWVFIDLNAHRINDIIKLARFGFCLLPPSLIPAIVANRLRTALVANLSETEMQVLRLLGRAYSNRRIADRLGLGEGTVKALVRSTLMKLRFRNRTEAGVFAARYGFALESSENVSD
jgi:DNA-binding NarL/FixJ family response regulator